MRCDRVDSNGLATKGLVKHNHQKLDDRRDVRGGVTGKGLGVSEEDEERVNGDTERGKYKRLEMAMISSVHQRSHQQSQGPVIHWERFLPLRSLKVLLVENDDSTRHVVSALLRNCSYEVMSGSDGLEAWSILTDLTNHIDLVLTEISMPNLSGIGLLSKIMNHKSFKNLPVIMMSGNDSMGIVFKCLSKGAVDFLVKPIRKNELKNLWQHVWRKYHSSNYSGSESGVRIQKSSTSNSTEESENNSDNIEEDDVRSIELNARDGSDNGSGIQSTWTKRAVEVDSPQRIFPWERQVADPPDSTCAQVIHSKPEAFCNNRVPVTATMDCHGRDCDLDAAMVKDLENGIAHKKNTDLHTEKRIKTISTTPAHGGSSVDEPFILEYGKDGKELEKGKLEKNNDKINAKPRHKAGDAIGGSINRSDPQVEIIATEVESNLTQMNIKGKNLCRAKDIPNLELSLKRMRDAEEIDMSTIEKNVFKHSDLSAFSRYMSNTNQAPTGIVGSCSPPDHSSEVEKIETVQNFQSNSNGTPDQGSNGSSNNNDKGSTTNNNKPVAHAVMKLHPSSSKSDPFENPPFTSLQSITQYEVNTVLKDNILSQERGMNPQVHQVQLHYHHYHRHHHHQHVHGTKQQLHFLNHDNSSLKTTVAKYPNCGASDGLQKKPREGNAANYSFNSSASGSNNGSDGQNGSSGQIGSSTAITNDGEKVAMVIDMGLAGKGEVGAATANGCRMGLDQNRLTQREAALNKFRQKRKERCFHKKVRYQSRKRLAEQRPRIRGQFVRQVARDNEEDS